MVHMSTKVRDLTREDISRNEYMQQNDVCKHTALVRIDLAFRVAEALARFAAGAPPRVR